MASRRTQLEQHTILCAKRDSLETKIDESEQYKELRSHGNEGAASSFVDLEPKLFKVLTQIANIERQLEL